MPIQPWHSLLPRKLRAETVSANAKNVSCPVLVIGNTADNACTPSHTYRLYDAVGNEDKELREIKGATHYYAGQPKHCAEAIDVCTEWLVRKGLGAESHE